MSKKHLKALRFSVSVLLVGGLVAAVSQGGGGAAGAEVVLVEVEQKTVTEAVKATGTLGARRSWPVSSGANGTIREILVANGQQVNKGDVIVRLASEATNKAADQAAALYKSAVSQKQMFDASISSGSPNPSPSVNTASLGAMAASLAGELGALNQATSMVTAQANQAALPETMKAQLSSIGTQNVLSFVNTLLARRGEIQRVAGELATSSGNVQTLVNTLIATIRTLEGGNVQEIVPSIMNLSTQASTGLGDIVTFATALQNLMGLLTLPPAAADEMPTDAVSSVLNLLGGQRAGMDASLGGLGSSLDKVQKNLVQVLGSTVIGVQSSLSAVGGASTSAMSTALSTYVEAAASMKRSADEKKAALELRAPESGLISLGTLSGTPSAAASGSGGILDSLTGGSGGGIDGAIGSVLGGLSSGGGTDPQPIISVGSDVAGGQKLFTIYDTGAWSARVTVDESKISRLATGMPAIVTVTSLGKTFPATVNWVAPVGNNSSGSASFALEAGFTASPEEAAALRIGTKVEVAITLSQVGPAPVIKSAALVKDGGKFKVFVVRDGKTFEREVTLKATDGVDVAVDGLEIGEQVILAPLEIEDGQAVKVVE